VNVRASAKAAIALPSQTGLFYGGAWHPPVKGKLVEVTSPSTGDVLGVASEATEQDAVAAIAAAREGFEIWRRVPPLERASTMRKIADVLRQHASEIALLDAADGGNPVHEMQSDALIAAGLFDFFAGLVTEIKGASIPMGPDAVNFSVREPIGVVARIVAFNHPFMFSAGKMAAPLAAGNSVIIKPPEQAPLSGLRLAEIVGHLLPAGVFNLLTGGREVGATLAGHRGVDMVTLIGSVPTGRAVLQAASQTLKPVIFELGGKNALIALPDADPAEVAEAAVAGMNYTWCGQSCGSTSRLFLHEAIHDAVLAEMPKRIAHYRPGIPTDPATTMGAIVSKTQYDRIMEFIASAKSQGARLICGGSRPKSPELANGNFIEPTVFADVTPDMKIAREEIFGPVQAVLRWNDEEEMLKEVNAVEYGLTGAVFTHDIDRAHRIAAEIRAGYVWINKVSTHFLGAPFGGMKQSGIGREDCLGELLAFTQEKNIHIHLRRGARA
jgi:betaine-aldehyde dehydrogenase